MDPEVLVHPESAFRAWPLRGQPWQQDAGPGSIKGLAEDPEGGSGMSEEKKNLQDVLGKLEKVLDDAFIEHVRELVIEATNDDKLPLDMLGKLLANILFRRLKHTNEKPIEVFSKAGVEALKSFGRPFKIEVAGAIGPDGELQSVSVTEHIDGSKFLESLEQQCAEDKELCIKMIAVLAAAYGLKHQDEEIMFSIFEPVFQEIGIKTTIHEMAFLGADFTKDL